MDQAEDTLRADIRAIQRVRGGDPEAFGGLVDRYFPLVHAIALARLGDPAAAEDLAQEVFLRAYLNLDKLHKPEAFPAWVARMARNLGINWLRASSRSSRLLPMVTLEDSTMENVPDEQPSAREEIEARQRSRGLHEAIANLNPEQREMVLLHYMEGYSKKDVATHLGVHPSTVGRSLDKSLEQLKGLLEPALREATQPLRARRQGSRKAMAYVLAAAVMTGGAREALAGAAATGVSSSAGGATTATAAAASMAFLQSIWGMFAAGGMAAGIVKGVVAVAAIATAVAGINHYRNAGGAVPVPSQSTIQNAATADPRVIDIPNLYDGTARAWRVDSVNQVTRNGQWVDSGVRMRTLVEILRADPVKGAEAVFTIEDLTLPDGHADSGVEPLIDGFRYYAQCGPGGGFSQMQPAGEGAVTPQMSAYIGQAMRADITPILAVNRWEMGRERRQSIAFQMPGYETGVLNFDTRTRYEGLRQVDGREYLLISSDFTGELGTGFQMLEIPAGDATVRVMLDKFDFSGNGVYLLDPVTRQVRLAEYTTATSNIRTRVLRYNSNGSVEELPAQPVPDEHMREVIRVEYL
jgi:RNA polymerase sigma-70 factor (ECF subfamily)